MVVFIWSYIERQALFLIKPNVSLSPVSFQIKCTPNTLPYTVIPTIRPLISLAIFIFQKPLVENKIDR